MAAGREGGGGGREREERRSERGDERAERGHTAALRPTREEQRPSPEPAAARGRVGGRVGRGLAGRRNGCHVARWIAALRPRPGSGP